MGGNIYYAWIPILTKRILFDYFVEELEKQRITDKNKIRSLDEVLSKTNGKYYICEIPEDAKNIKFKAIISIDDKNVIDYVLVYDSKDNLKTIAKCNIEDNGLIKLELIGCPKEIKEWEYDERIISIYIPIRDTYHHHTHHEKNEDSLLKPVSAKDKAEAIAKILKQFEEKIINHHRVINFNISLRDFDDARQLIIKAKGEMIYASSFVKLFEKDILDPFSYSFVFSNAFQSIDVLAHDLELRHEYRLNRMIMVLTVGILIFTAPIAIDATFGILKYLGAELTLIIKDIVLLFYTLVLLALLLIIYKPFKK